jgi:hypothetical protein
VDHLAGQVVFVTDLGVPRGPDRPAGDRIDRGQGRGVVTGQDPPDRGGVQAEFGGQYDRATAPPAPRCQYLLLDPGREPVR